ncbi:MAG: hypothetical protein O3A84_09700 [Proteobacteria bacterium]|nr:hypothetical protein [Pseudomonadota bacterium]
MRRFTFLSLIVFTLGACAQIPQGELKAYVDSVTTARNQGETLTADWQSAIQEFRRRQATTSPSPTPSAGATPFPPLVSNDGNSPTEPNASEVRLLAWSAIGAYTDVLGQLAAGKGVDEVKGTAGRLFDVGVKLSGATIPGGGAIASVIQSLVGELEKARQAAEFKEAIKAAAPTIQNVISKVFIPDTVSHYGLRTSLAAEDHAAMILKPDVPSGSRALRQKRIEDEMAALRASLNGYRQLLLQVNKSIGALKLAVDRPPDFVLEANRILDIAAEVKTHWMAYENARKEASN